MLTGTTCSMIKDAGQVIGDGVDHGHAKPSTLTYE